MERSQPDLVTSRDGARRGEYMCARSPLLGSNDRFEHPVDRGVELLHDRVVLVEAGAVDFHDQLRPGLVECIPLELLDRLAEDLAKEVAGTRPTFERG